MSTKLGRIAKKAKLDRGAVHFVGPLADAGVPQRNLANDEPGRSKWRRRAKHQTVCERDGEAGRGDLCTAE